MKVVVLESPNLDLSIVVHIGFAEVRFLLETLKNERGIATEVPWFSSDSTFEDASVPSAVRDIATSVGFKGIQFLGYNVDSKPSIFHNFSTILSQQFVQTLLLN